MEGSNIGEKEQNHELTLCSKILYLVNNFPAIYWAQNYLPYSQKPTTFPYLEPDGTSRQPSDIKINFNYTPLFVSVFS